MSVQGEYPTIRLMAAQQPIDSATQQPPTVLGPTGNTYHVEANWLLATVLVVITLVAYQPVWHAGFIWDDDVLITENRMVTANDGLRRIWLTTEAPDYFPLTSSMWWLEWRLWGNGATGYHAVQLLLHAINVVLVWLLLSRLKVPGAWLAAAIFAVHPVNAATVAWISEQKNTLSILFFLVSAWCYLKSEAVAAAVPSGDTGDASDDRRYYTKFAWYFLSLTAFLLALLSKTAVVMLPVVLVGCMWWLRGRAGWRDLRRTTPFFALSLIFGAVTVWFHHNRALTLGNLSVPADGLVTRLTAATWAFWFYLCKAILPWNLCAIYPKWTVETSWGLSFAPGLILAAGLIVVWLKRDGWGKPVLFGLGYYAVTLLPVLGLLHVSFHEYSLVADHWQYHAIAGVIALVTATGIVGSRRLREPWRAIGMIASTIVVVALGVATWNRAGVYASSESLWRDTAAKNPRSWVARFNLGNAHLRAGRHLDAIDEYRQTVRIKPDLEAGHNNLALALLQIGNTEEAIEHLEQVVRIRPDSAEGCANMGNAYMQARQAQAAVRHYEQAVRLKPDYVEARVALGFALAQQGRLDEATREWETALRLDPGNSDAQRGLERVRLFKSSGPSAP